MYNKVKIVVGIIIIILLTTFGVRSCTTTEVLDTNIQQVDIVVDTVEEIEEVPIVIVEELPIIRMIPSIEVIEKKIVETEKVEIIAPIEEVKEVVEEVATEAPVEVTIIVEDVETKSKPITIIDANIGIEVGAFNDLDRGGTLVYALPVYKVDVYQINGIGAGGYFSIGIGMLNTKSIVTSGLLGVSYGHKFDNFKLSGTGGLYGSIMQYEQAPDYLYSVGLGLETKLLFPFNNNNHCWGVSLGIATGFIGDPNGSITLGFTLN